MGASAVASAESSALAESSLLELGFAFAVQGSAAEEAGSLAEFSL